MADVAFAAAIRKVADILGNLLVDEGTRWYWLQDDIRWIHTEMRRIQLFLKGTEDIQGNSEGVANLIEEIRDLGFDVEDVIDTFFPKLASHRNKRSLGCLSTKVSCNPISFTFTRHKFGMEIARIKKWIEDINRAQTTYGNTGNTSREEEQDLRQTFPHVEVPNIIGFETQTEKLRAKLLDEDTPYCVISIVGMPGLGKTTLAREVFNSVKQGFQCYAWVYISQEPRLRDVLQDIGRQVGLAKEMREESLEANLFKFLREKRYVLVLDDIWKPETWDALKNAIPCNSNHGSRLILTSRARHVGVHIGGENSLHVMEPLDSGNSWELFSNIVMIPLQNINGSFRSPQMEDTGRQILEKCGGVPLAIMVMGSHLLCVERTLPAWKRFLGSMGHGRPGISKILALSYKDLSQELKQCFLYFGLFPEDHEIPATKLINLWVAEGFVQTRGEQTPEDTGEDNLHELISRNLIQVVRRRFDGRVRTCRIHDLLRNLCISEANKNFFFTTHDNIDSTYPKRVRRLTTYRSSICDYISLGCHTPSLRALLCVNNNEEILQNKQLEYIQKGLGLLRVLSLEGVTFPPTLPDAIGNLVHLSYLELGRDGLVRLPSTIGNLKNLKTLDARQCNNLVLPTVMWKMKELRHIILTPIATFEYQSKSIGQLQPIEDVSLPNLQTLHMINGNILKADCLRKFTNLRKLGLVCDVAQVTIILSDAMTISDKLEKLTLTVLPSKKGKETKVDLFNADTYPLLDLPACPALSFSAYQNLSSLYLEGGFKKLLDFPTSLIKLTLLQIQLEEDPMETLGKLPNLKKLYLGRFSYMGLKMVISGPGTFPSLEDLIIELLPLKELEVDEEVMPKLRYVKIKFDVTLKIHSSVHSDRLKRIFSEFNDYLMRMSFLELDLDLKHFPGWLDDDIFFLEEEDFILEPSKDANKGKELMPDEVAKQDTVEDPNGISKRPLELGQCSSSGGQSESEQRKSGDAN